MPVRSFSFKLVPICGQRSGGGNQCSCEHRKSSPIVRSEAFDEHARKMIQLNGSQRVYKGVDTYVHLSEIDLQMISIIAFSSLYLSGVIYFIVI